MSFLSPRSILPVALSIAGSDSSAGAGIQADLRTFFACGVRGMTAITAVTAQNLEGVAAIDGIDTDLVEAQVQSIASGFRLVATKTGMLWSKESVDRVASLSPLLGQLIVDPVILSTSGSRLLEDGAIDSYRQKLLPRATLCTPNLDEAAELLSRPAITSSELSSVALELHQRFGCAVLLKGGHLKGDPIDTLCSADELVAWTHPRILDVNTHGSGCALSAAITAYLALGSPLIRACEQGLGFVHRSLEQATPATDRFQLANLEGAHQGDDPLIRLYHQES